MQSLYQQGYFDSSNQIQSWSEWIWQNLDEFLIVNLTCVVAQYVPDIEQIFHHAWSETESNSIVFGKRNGVCKIVMKDEVVIHTMYVNGQRQGPCQSWYKDGKRRHTARFVNDRGHGTVTWRDENGRIELIEFG